MLLILFIILSVVLFVLYLKQKNNLEKLTHEVAELEEQLKNNSSEEFSLGFDRINNETLNPSLLDPLTGLPGLKVLEDRFQQNLKQSKRYGKSFAVMLFDINEMQDINASKGNLIADKLLREVANRLRTTVRQIDTVTRYAGNKFVFLLPQLSMPETAAYAAQRLLDSIIRAFQIDGQEFLVTANIGIAIYPSDGQDTKSLLLNTEVALAKSKNLGNSRYQFCHEEIHVLGQRELSLHAFLSGPDLLQNLTIDFKPYINIVTNQIACTQAVLNLNHPTLGLINFLDFSRIAENCGKNIEIGEWFVKHALSQFKVLSQNNTPSDLLMITITLRQLEDAKFMNYITEALKENLLSPKNLIIEIADKNLFVNTNSLEKAFALLSHVGVQISLSIFALGHLALQKITKLPVNYLKIDAKLLSANQTNPENDTVLKTLISLAKEMNIYIIADGIDNEKKDLTKKLGL